MSGYGEDEGGGGGSLLGYLVFLSMIVGACGYCIEKSRQHEQRRRDRMYEKIKWESSEKSPFLQRIRELQERSKQPKQNASQYTIQLEKRIQEQNRKNLDMRLDRDIKTIERYDSIYQRAYENQGHESDLTTVLRDNDCNNITELGKIAKTLERDARAIIQYKVHQIAKDALKKTSEFFQSFEKKKIQR